MPLAGFIEMPPVSKVTPFPTRAKGASSPAAFPIHHHHKGVAPATLPNPQKGTHSQLFHRSFVKDFDLKAKRAKRLNSVTQIQQETIY
jgi:hypothetical protein